MKREHRTSNLRFRALTLVELVVALTALAIIVLGHSLTGYNARLDIQRSVWRSAAAATALALLESWAAGQGAANYDPVADLGSQLTIAAGSGPGAPAGFTSQGSYTIVTDGITYRATLSSCDLESTLRALNVVVAWSDRSAGDPPALTWDFRLTTYVALD
jgi:Tfp pilus assembly protein PilV